MNGPGVGTDDEKFSALAGQRAQHVEEVWIQRAVP